MLGHVALLLHAHLPYVRHPEHARPLEERWLHEALIESYLPLVEVPAKQPAGDLLAVIVSGDGGWAGIDHDVANDLASKGVPVVGLNSLQYFWNARTPDGAAADLQRIARHYLPAWGRQQLLLVGYSLGADVLPFMASRLPPDLLGRVPSLDPVSSIST